MIPAWVRWGSLALAVVSLLASVYLAVSQVAQTPLACPSSGALDCAKVTSSTYSTVAGVPVAYGGVAWSVLMTVLCLPWAWSRKLHLSRLLVALVGFVSVLYLVWAEIMLGALCLWCTLVHVSVVGLSAAAAAGWVLDTPRTTSSSSPEVAQERA